MKRLLGSFALVLVPSVLAVPTRASAVALEPQTQAVSAITVADIAARARRVVGLANRRDRVQLAALATPTMVSFLIDIGGNRRWERATPSCRKSVASRPGDTVYACRAAIDVNQWEVDESWWLYFRKVDGRWLAVNKSIATSRTDELPDQEEPRSPHQQDLRARLGRQVERSGTKWLPICRRPWSRLSSTTSRS